MMDFGILLAVMAAAAGLLGAFRPMRGAFLALVALAAAAGVLRLASGTASMAEPGLIALALAAGAGLAGHVFHGEVRREAGLIGTAFALAGIGQTWSHGFSGSALAVSHGLSGIVFALATGCTLVLVVRSASPSTRLLFALLAACMPLFPAGEGLVRATGAADLVLTSSQDAASLVRTVSVPLAYAAFEGWVRSAQALFGLALVVGFVAAARGSQAPWRLTTIFVGVALAVVGVAGIGIAVRAWTSAQHPLETGLAALGGALPGRSVSAVQWLPRPLTSLDLTGIGWAFARATLVVALGLPQTPKVTSVEPRWPWTALALALIAVATTGALLGRAAWGQAWAMDPQSLAGGAALVVALASAWLLPAARVATTAWLQLATVALALWALVGPRFGWTLASWHPPL
jgi:hypothetical protein